MGQLPSGVVARWTDDELTKHLREQYIFSQSEESRQTAAAERLDLYHDRGGYQIRRIADEIFRNAKVRQWRRKFIDLAMFQNLTKRIIREVSAVYSEPATRRVATTVEQYKELQRVTQQDRCFRRLNQYVNLLNECFLWFDVDQFSRRPRIRVVTPDRFWAVCHPMDPTHLVAVIIRQTPLVERPSDDMAHYLVLAPGEFFRLDGRGRMMEGTRTALGIDGLPGVLVHRALPEDRLLDMDTGGDLISAHHSIALINTMLLKQQKSGTKQAVAQGDLADMATDQAMDEEHLLQVPDGVTVSVLDMGADPANYTNAARYVIKSIAANWGMPESVFDLSYQASSGFEIELKRTALREIRRDQILDLRPVEREFAEVQSAVLDAAAHELRFKMDGWRIDFGEIEAPRDPMQRLAYFEKRRQLGLTNTLEMIMLENPEFDEAEALETLISNVQVESRRVEMMRALNIDTSATTEDPGEDPSGGGDLEKIAREVLNAAD